MRLGTRTRLVGEGMALLLLLGGAGAWAANRPTLESGGVVHFCVANR